MPRIGIMQGRLSSLVDGKIQSFPRETWQEEFALAKECGFEIMEWVLDDIDVENNPIWSAKGQQEIIQLKDKHEIDVPSICCDYFMEFPLQSEDHNIKKRSREILFELIGVCSEIGISNIELPMIGKAALEDEEKGEEAIGFLNDITPLIEQKKINILLEVSLPPDRIMPLFEKMPSQRIGINYDTGNSAYWGYSAYDEIPVYGGRIGNVHIKDCTPQDYSVFLGRGNVNFDVSLKLLYEIGYQDDFILQAARAKDSSHVELAKQFYQFTDQIIQKYWS
jgi:L-ribulose-5-phosphate 3-epimerase